MKLALEPKDCGKEDAYVYKDACYVPVSSHPRALPPRAPRTERARAGAEIRCAPLSRIVMEAAEIEPAAGGFRRERSSSNCSRVVFVRLSSRLRRALPHAELC